MAIQEKTPRERVALQFKAAGLGDRSAREAARLLFETGVSFETAAVLGQRTGEASKATRKSIQEAANTYRRAASGPPTTTAWGRPIAESAQPGPQAPASPATSESKRPPSGAKVTRHPDKTKVINGVLHEEISWFERVPEAETRKARLTESQRPTTNAWGRPLTEEKDD